MPAFSLTDKQTEVRDMLAGDATHNLIYGGSRSGKTFVCCYAFAARGLQAPKSRHLICRLHNIDVRQAVMMDTWPKMMDLAFPGVPYDLNKTDQFVTLDGDAEIWFGGLDDKERVDKILGKEFAGYYVNEASQVAYATILTLRTRLAQSVTKRDGRRLALKAYYDLNPVGKAHWTYKEFIDLVYPGDERPVKPGTRRHIIVNPMDNPHLAQEYLDELDALPERQRKRFKLGQYLTEVPGALWPLDTIEALRVHKDAVPQLQRIVVAVDPSGSDGAGSDMQGIVAVGLGIDGHAYVLHDRSCKLTPRGWATRAINLYHEMEADVLVAEVNFGGQMVEATIQGVDESVCYKAVNASRGKHVRAEPVAALYETIVDDETGAVIRTGRVHHVGTFPELEEQMGMMTTVGYEGSGSPDRLDALVWALTELMLATPVKGAAYLQMAAAHAAGLASAKPATEKKIEYQAGSVEWAREQAALRLAADSGL